MEELGLMAGEKKSIGDREFGNRLAGAAKIALRLDEQGGDRGAAKVGERPAEQIMGCGREPVAVSLEHRSGFVEGGFGEKPARLPGRA